MLKFILFADDINVFCADSDITRLVKTINAALDKLNMWFAVNKLSLNVSKTNYIIFGKHKYDKNKNFITISIIPYRVMSAKAWVRVYY